MNLKIVAKGLCFGLISMLVILNLCTVLLLYTDLSEMQIAKTSPIIFFAILFFTAMFVAVKVKEKILIYGLLIALLWFGICLGMQFLLGFGDNLFLKFAICIISTLSGSIIGILFT